jgi:hypothetical protein
LVLIISELESNQRIKSGAIQSIGGYYALVVALIVGIFFTPKFIGSIGEVKYAEYAYWQVNAAFLYSFFPASGRMILIENIEKTRALGFILLGGLASLSITTGALFIFKLPTATILYLILFLQLIIYLSDQIRSWFQTMDDGRNIAASVIMTRTIHLLLLSYLFPNYTLQNFVLSLVFSECIGFMFLITLIRVKRIIPSFTSIRISDFIPYYFESNANKALAESFLKSQGAYLPKIKFGSLSLIYRLNETASRAINIPINAFTNYFVNLKESEVKVLNRAMWVPIVYGLISLLLIFHYEHHILTYFNLSENVERRLVVLIVGAITMSLLRPVVTLKMNQIGLRKLGLYFPFFELMIFWCLVPFTSYSILLAPVILYTIVIISAAFRKELRAAVIFILPILCFLLILSFLAIQKLGIPDWLV